MEQKPVLTSTLLWPPLCEQNPVLAYRRVRARSPRILLIVLDKWDRMLHTYLQIAFLTQQYLIEIPLSPLVES